MCCHDLPKNARTEGTKTPRTNVLQNPSRTLRRACFSHHPLHCVRPSAFSDGQPWMKRRSPPSVHSPCCSVEPIYWQHSLPSIQCKSLSRMFQYTRRSAACKSRGFSHWILPLRPPPPLAHVDKASSYRLAREPPAAQHTLMAIPRGVLLVGTLNHPYARRTVTPPRPFLRPRLIQSMSHTPSRVSCAKPRPQPSSMLSRSAERSQHTKMLCPAPSQVPAPLLWQAELLCTEWCLPRSLHWFRTFLHIGEFQCACASTFCDIFFFIFPYFYIAWALNELKIAQKPPAADIPTNHHFFKRTASERRSAEMRASGRL